MPNHDLTDITIVLDRSGSMESVRDDTIGGFNHFLADQKSAPGRANLSLVQFDTEYEPLHEGKPIADVPNLTPETFVPRGGTALLDAIGRTISATGARLGSTAEQDRPGKVVFVILTDGLENSSREFTKAKVNEMITHQRDAYQWQFVFLGANQDAIQAGAAIGVPTSNAMTFAANAKGLHAGYNAVNTNLRAYRGGQSAGMDFSPEQREEQAKAGAKK